MEPLNTLPKYNLFGLDDQDYSKSKIVVLPVPYDSTTTYQSGARNGPRAIINASRNIELYSYEVGADISKLGIYTTDELAPDLSSPENMVKRISKEVGIILDDKKVPLLLGGEHTITIGAVQAFKQREEELSIIQFDAHTDSRDELFGSRYMHATVMSRVSELYDNFVQVGIRSIDEGYAKRMDKSKVILADEIYERGAEDIAEQINSMTSNNVYLTIDLDVLDPSEMPSVGTPEPGGVSFSNLLKIIKIIGKRKSISGIDIVELNPIPYFEAPNFLAAKLAYLALGYSFIR
ncbi:MAG: agmatinase [Candidatus Micrarchaeia archaeon]